MIKYYDNYDLEVDNKNVFTRVFQSDKGLIEEKVFQILPGIFISPNREVPNIETKEAGVYDKNYVSTKENKSKFLKNMSILFQRIEKTVAGKDLLTCLSQSNTKILTDDSNYLYVLDNSKGKSNKKIPFSVLISPPDNSLSEIVTKYTNKDNISNLLGTSCNIKMTPDLTFSYYNPKYNAVGDVKAGEFFKMDPAVILYHEMVHAFRGNIGLTHNTRKISKIDTSIEEGLTFGGNAEKYLAKQDIKDEKDSFKRRYKNTFEKFNEEDPKKLQALSNIYLFDIKDNNKIDTKTLDNSFENFYEKAVFQFSEERISQELGIKYKRQYYSQKSLKPIFFVDISDTSHYTVELGMNKTVLGTDEVNMVHPYYHNNDFPTTGLNEWEQSSSSSSSNSDNESERVRERTNKLIEIFNRSSNDAESDPSGSRTDISKKGSFHLDAGDDFLNLSSMGSFSDSDDPKPSTSQSTSDILKSKFESSSSEVNTQISSLDSDEDAPVSKKSKLDNDPDNKDVLIGFPNSCSISPRKKRDISKSCKTYKMKKFAKKEIQQENMLISINKLLGHDLDKLKVENKIKPYNKLLNKNEIIPENKILDLEKSKDLKIVSKVNLNSQFDTFGKITDTNLNINSEFIEYHNPMNILNIQKLNNISNTKKPIIFTSNPQKVSNKSNVSFTYMKNVKKTNNSFIKGIDKGTSVIDVISYIDTLYEDFTTNIYKKNNLRKVEDIVSIIPVIGDVFGIGVELHEGEYTSAAIRSTIFVIMLIMVIYYPPSAAIFGVIMAARYINDKVKKNNRTKLFQELEKKYIYGIISYISSYSNQTNMYQTKDNVHKIKSLADVITAQFKHTLYVINYNASTIIENSNFTDKEKNKLYKKLDKKNKKAWHYILKSRRAIIHLVCKLIRKQNEQYKQLLLSKKEELLNQIKAEISSILIQDDPFYETELLNHLLDNINTSDVDKMINSVVSSYDTWFKDDVKRLKEISFPVLELKIDQNDTLKAEGLYGIKILTNKNMSISFDRNMERNAICLDNSSELKITHPNFLSVSFNKNFSMSFWIKDISNKDHIDKYSFMDNDLFKIYIENNSIYIESSALNLLPSYNSQLIKNSWYKVSIVYNHKKQVLELYLNDEKRSIYVLKSQAINLKMKELTIKLQKENNKVNNALLISDFKIYHYTNSPEYDYYYDFIPNRIYDCQNQILNYNEKYIFAFAKEYNLTTNKINVSFLCQDYLSSILYFKNQEILYEDLVSGDIKVEDLLTYTLQPSNLLDAHNYLDIRSLFYLKRLEDSSVEAVDTIEISNYKSTIKEINNHPFPVKKLKDDASQMQDKFFLWGKEVNRNNKTKFKILKKEKYFLDDNDIKKYTFPHNYFMVSGNDNAGVLGFINSSKYIAFLDDSLINKTLKLKMNDVIPLDLNKNLDNTNTKDINFILVPLK